MKKFTMVALLIALCSVCFGTIDDESYKKWMQQGIEQVTQGDLKESRESFQNALLFKPNDAEAQRGIQLAEERMSSGQPSSGTVSEPAAVGTAANAEGKVQISVNAMYYFPKDDENYNYGYGGELQGRYFINPNVAIAAAVGLSSWWTKEEHEFWMEEGNSYYVNINEAQIQMVPIGASVIYNAPLLDRLSINLEAGARYVIINSDLNVYYTENSLRLPPYKFEFESGLVGVFGAELQLRVSKYMHLLAGLGYQFDLVKGDIKRDGEAFTENELEAMTLSAGISLDF